MNVSLPDLHPSVQLHLFVKQPQHPDYLKLSLPDDAYVSDLLWEAKIKLEIDSPFDKLAFKLEAPDSEASEAGILDNTDLLRTEPNSKL